MLHEFLVAAELDAVGVFGYSDEDGTEASSAGRTAAGRRGIENRRAAYGRPGRGADQPAGRVPGSGSRCRSWSRRSRRSVTGRAAHQGPEVDGTVRLLDAGRYRVGELVDAVVVEQRGCRSGGRGGGAMVSEPRPTGSTGHRRRPRRPIRCQRPRPGGQLLERAQRADRVPDRARPGLRLDAAGPSRRSGLAGADRRRLHPGHPDRQPGRLPGPSSTTSSPGSASSPTRSPTRR